MNQDEIRQKNKMTESQTNRFTEIQKDKKTKRQKVERQRDVKKNGRDSGSDDDNDNRCW